MSRAALFEVERAPRWTGTRALALSVSVDCHCGPVYRGSYTQPALFYHGGHGAAERIESTWCMCGRIRMRDSLPINPRKL